MVSFVATLKNISIRASRVLHAVITATGKKLCIGAIMPSGYFEFMHANADGSIMSEPFRVETEAGVIINCHAKCDVSQVRRICEMARENPGYPYDLSAWRDTAEGKAMIWSARIYWRNRK